MSGLLRVPSTWIVPRKLALPEGVRASVRADFQLVCGAGPYELDVLVRSYDSPGSLEFQGQVTWADCIHDPVPDLALTLVEPEEQEPLRTTSTDGFGEFGFSSDVGTCYGLRLGETPESPCVLVWEGEEW